VIRHGNAVIYRGPALCIRTDDDHAPGTL
jgi:hypothetical protein